MPWFTKLTVVFCERRFAKWCVARCFVDVATRFFWDRKFGTGRFGQEDLDRKIWDRKIWDRKILGDFLFSVVRKSIFLPPIFLSV